MDNIAEGLNMLLTPIGLKARTLLIDYRGNNGESNGIHYNTDAYCPINYSDKFIVTNLITDFEKRDFTVTRIIEILDGYSYADIKAIERMSPKEAAEHMKLLYFTE